MRKLPVIDGYDHTETCIGKDPAYWRAFFIKYQERIEFAVDAHNL